MWCVHPLGEIHSNQSCRGSSRTIAGQEEDLGGRGAAGKRMEDKQDGKNKEKGSLGQKPAQEI